MHEPPGPSRFGRFVLRANDSPSVFVALARVRIDPRDPNLVYVCALGHTWGPNVERRVIKTTDGGKTWS